ncbi:MAG: hypothetical protein RLZZ598_1698 [Pseudomonadota bacterium]|jgi:uncharacterized membrane protein
MNPPPPAATLASPFGWLAAGWRDLRATPLASLAHGVLCAAFGALLFRLAHDRFWVLVGAFSGFLLVAPVLATGLYAMSRARELGRVSGVARVAGIWGSLDRRLVFFGLGLAAAGTGWVFTSAALITAFADLPIRAPIDFVRHVMLAPGVFGLFEVWLLMGGLLVAPVFASSVVAMPLLVDRLEARVGDAIVASWRAVVEAPGVCALWAALIMGLVGLGLATALLGLIVIVPWLGHASWHAYRELTPRDAP